MSEFKSLFAEKLRSFRASHGAHGRLTQEELADMLGVSVDAVSKYERSLSFIRGDLEHRLSEKLGWSRDEVVACREDWAARAMRSQGEYRLFREAGVVAELGSFEALDSEIQSLEKAAGHEFPDGYSASEPIWLDIARDGSLCGAYVMCNGKMVGHLAIVFFSDTLKSRFYDRQLVETEFSLDTLKRPVLPGDYFGYFAGVYLVHGHQKAALHLLSGFVDILEELMEREVYLRELGAIAASPIGRQLCKDLGFDFIGAHTDDDTLEFWSFSGANLPRSLLAQRSPKLKKAYTEHFGKN